MKRIMTISIAAVAAFACSHHQQPPPATPSTSATQTALVAPPEPANAPIAPGVAAIPSEPQVAPPKAPAVQPAEKLPVATSSNFAAPRPESLPAVAPDPVRDQPETSADAGIIAPDEPDDDSFPTGTVQPGEDSEARAIFHRACTARRLPPFVTSLAYERIVTLLPPSTE